MARKKQEEKQPHGGDRVIARNRKAYHDYEIEETLEAGIVLTGSEIKSVRAGRVNLRDSYVSFRGPQVSLTSASEAHLPRGQSEAWLVGAHISSYASASYQDHEPLRERKLLLHRREIERWRARVEQRGYTVVPLSLYLKDNRAKVEIALARGKRQYDKREAIRERETERAVQRGIREAMREGGKGRMTGEER